MLLFPLFWEKKKVNWGRKTQENNIWKSAWDLRKVNDYFYLNHLSKISSFAINVLISSGPRDEKNLKYLSI